MRSFLTFAFSIIFATSAHSASVDIIETTDYPDFNGLGGNFPVTGTFTPFMLGVNSVNGSTSYSDDGTLNSVLDDDFVLFRILPGQKITSLTIRIDDISAVGDFSNFFSGPTARPGIFTPTFSSPTGVDPLDGIDVLGNLSGGSLTQAVDVGPGDYFFSLAPAFGVSLITGVAFDVSYAYRVEVTVAPIPLPAGALLLLTGIGGLAAARRLRRDA
ncbi:MAG: VPLPA-CTERM sorting domain-containing protein [Pseudomonadota bacterium]